MPVRNRVNSYLNERSSISVDPSNLSDRLDSAPLIQELPSGRPELKSFQEHRQPYFSNEFKQRLTLTIRADDIVLK